MAADGPPTLPALLRALRDRANILVVIAHGSTYDNESFLWLEGDNGAADGWR